MGLFLPNHLYVSCVPSILTKWILSMKSCSLRLKVIFLCYGHMGKHPCAQRSQGRSGMGNLGVYVEGVGYLVQSMFQQHQR